MDAVRIVHRINRLPLIETDRLILRDIEVADISTEYVKWLNDRDVNQYLEIRLEPQTEESTREYVEEKLRDTTTNKHFGVYDSGGTRLVGTVTVLNINWHHRYADISFVIGHPDAREKGYATEAVQGVVHYMFTCCCLEKLWAGYYEGNTVSARVLEKNGFSVEGRIRKKLLNHRNERVDHILVGLLADEYRERIT